MLYAGGGRSAAALSTERERAQRRATQEKVSSGGSDDGASSSLARLLGRLPPLACVHRVSISFFTIESSPKMCTASARSRKESLEAASAEAEKNGAFGRRRRGRRAICAAYCP